MLAGVALEKDNVCFFERRFVVSEQKLLPRLLPGAAWGELPKPIRKAADRYR